MAPIETDIIFKRLAGIEQDLAELRTLGAQDLHAFSADMGHKLAEYHLHRALEGVFNIASHLNSRKPGGTKAMSYKDIARTFGELGFIDISFARHELSTMAGYRNRLVHFYAEIKEPELYDIIRNNLGDFDIFLNAVKMVLKHPEKFNLAAE